MEMYVIYSPIFIFCFQVYSVALLLARPLCQLRRQLQHRKLFLPPILLSDPHIHRKKCSKFALNKNGECYRNKTWGRSNAALSSSNTHVSSRRSISSLSDATC